MQFPECQLTYINKNGYKKVKHIYICVGCDRQFIDCYQPHKGYLEEVKGEFLKMSVNGMGFRAIERAKGVIMLCPRKSCLNFVTTLPVPTY
jgi:transposase-like protein